MHLSLSSLKTAANSGKDKPPPGRPLHLMAVVTLRRRSNFELEDIAMTGSISASVRKPEELESNLSNTSVSIKFGSTSEARWVAGRRDGVQAAMMRQDLGFYSKA